MLFFLSHWCTNGFYWFSRTNTRPFIITNFFFMCFIWEYIQFICLLGGWLRMICLVCPSIANNGVMYTWTVPIILLIFFFYFIPGLCWETIGTIACTYGKYLNNYLWDSKLSWPYPLISSVVAWAINMITSTITLNVILLTAIFQFEYQWYVKLVYSLIERFLQSEKSWFLLAFSL